MLDFDLTEARRTKHFRHYFAHGLSIDSEISLPDLLERSEPVDGAPVLEIRIGPVSIGDHCPRTNWLIRDEGLHFSVQSGRRIWVESFAPDKAVQASLYCGGSGLGAALVQNGRLPLHANAISWGDRAVLVAGHSGAGKSTLTAQLLQRFQSTSPQLVSDDLCCIEEFQGKPMVWPGPQRLRLWADALCELEISSAGLSRVHPEMEKYVVPWTGTQERLEVGAIFILQRAAELDLQRLRGLDAFQWLATQVYKARVHEVQRIFPHLAPQLATLVHTVPIYRLTRPQKVDPKIAVAEILRELEALWPDQSQNRSACPTYT